jgi:hypothetical protein
MWMRGVVNVCGSGIRLEPVDGFKTLLHEKALGFICETSGTIFKTIANRISVVNYGNRGYRAITRIKNPY